MPPERLPARGAVRGVGGLARALARGPLLCEEARLNITGQNSTFDTEIGFALIQARLAETSFVLASICHAKNGPPVTKIRLWASFGV